MSGMLPCGGGFYSKMRMSGRLRKTLKILVILRQNIVIRIIQKWIKENVNLHKLLESDRDRTWDYEEEGGRILKQKDNKNPIENWDRPITLTFIIIYNALQMV